MLILSSIIVGILMAISFESLKLSYANWEGYTIFFAMGIMYMIGIRVGYHQSK